MGARKPGPICVTRSERHDSATSCLHRMDPPGPARADPRADPESPELKFASLWRGYPGSKPTCSA